MKRSVKILNLFSVLAVILTGCGKDTSSSTTSEVKNYKNFMENGICDYKIVVPESMSSYEDLSSQTFVEQFEKSTGIVLDIIKDKDADFTTSSKYVSIGLTSQAIENGYDVEADELKSSGYRLVNNENNIFVVGSQDVGTLYGTYDLLNILINYEAYDIDEIVVDTDVKDIQYEEFDIAHNPPIEATQNYEFNLINDNDYAHVMKNITGEESWVKINGRFCHTAPYLIPDSEKVNHPSWFGTDGSQLCYSTGIEDDEMLNYLYNNLKKYIDQYPKAKYVSVSQDDVATWCECDKCKASKERYGSNLAVMIKFVNKVADLVKRDYPDRELYVHTFSYHQTTDAITDHFDEVMCRDNVTVMFAPIRGNYTKSFDDETNITLKKSLQAISKICNYVTLWTYCAHYPNWLLPYNVYTGLKDRIRIYSENNVQFLFDQGEYQSSVPAFRKLRTYLLSKLSYDLSLNQEELTNNFFKNYYGPASASVKQYFDEFRCQDILSVEQLGLSYDINGANSMNTKYWPFNLLKQWEGYMNQALKDIEYLKYIDEDAYTKYYDRVVFESLSIRFLLIQLYGNSYYTTSEKYDMCIAFREDCYKYGVTYYGEGRSIETLFKTWGI